MLVLAVLVHMLKYAQMERAGPAGGWPAFHGGDPNKCLHLTASSLRSYVAAASSGR